MRIRRTAAVAAAAAMAVGLTGCEPAHPFFVSSTNAGYTVSNGYSPVVGDFDGDGWDDILFFEPDRWDALWEGRPNGRFAHLSAPAQLDGSYEGTVGDFGGDATDDVLWTRSDGDDVLWVMQAGGGLASTRAVSLPEASLETVDNAAGHDTLLVKTQIGRDVRVWDPDAGTGALTPLAASDPLVTTSGDFDGDGSGDVFLHRPGGSGDEIAWGDGDATFSIAATTNIGGSYQVHVLRADGDERDDIAFIDEQVGHEWALNLWFSEGRTFRRQAFSPLPNRGIYEVHRNHDHNGFDYLVKYTNGGAFAWSTAPSGTIVSATTPLPGPGTTPAFVGRFHDGLADDALVYESGGDHPEAFLRTTDRVQAVP
ncbi:MAG TPA: FG-GAP-like repeat-containing protein [Iamia sp.]|nr:FG-GAP-like repeat-containing protein [Iamia sp.]